MRTFATAVVLAIGLAVVGCGESDEDAAEQAAVSYFEAVADRDTDAACALSIDETDCEGLARFVGRNNLDFPEATNVSLSGDEGEVEITVSTEDKFVVPVQKDGDDWKIDVGEIKGQFDAALP